MIRTILWAIISVLITASIAAGAVIFQDNFDGYADSPTLHGWNNLGANVYTEYDVGYLGSRGIRVAYTGSGTEPYWLETNIESSTTLDIRVSFRFKIVGVPTGGAKFLKIFGKTFDPEGYANSTFSINDSSHTLSAVTYGIGDGILNDTQYRVRFDGVRTWDTDSAVVFDVSTADFVPYDNGWHLYEMRIKFNDDGARNGLYDIWIDGVQRLKATNVKNRNDQNSSTISRVSLANYCGATFTTPWELYIDDVVVTTGDTVGDVCGAANLSLCTTTETCTTAGGNYCDGVCQSAECTVPTTGGAYLPFLSGGKLVKVQ